MAFNTKLPIVTDGLILSVDPYNRKSYVSGSTIASDLTSNNNNGTLINGVGFDVNSWTFDGTNQYINLGQPVELNISSRTISVWFNSTDNTKSIYTRGASRGNTSSRDYDIYGNGTSLISMGVEATPGPNIQLLTPYPTLGDWHEVVTTWDGTTNVDGAKLYLDGILVDTDTANVATQAERFDHYIGGDGSSPYPFEGSESTVKWYNRPLTLTEVEQNYNALKGRFI